MPLVKNNRLLCDNSMLECYRECPRKFYWQYVEGWGFKREHEPDYFIAGRAWQEGLMEWYGKGTKQERKKAAHEAIYVGYKDCDELALEQMNMYRTPGHLCKVFDKYVQSFGKEHWEVIKQEHGFKFVFMIINGIECWLGGAVDGIIYWPAFKQQVVLENKTTLGYLGPQMQQMFDMSNQIQTYLFYLYDRDIELRNDYICLVNQVTFKLPPAAPKKGWDRQIVGRFIVRRNLEQLRDFENQLVMLYEDILYSLEENRWPKKGTKCGGGYGMKPCMFKDLCMHQPYKDLSKIVVDKDKFEKREWNPWDRAGARHESSDLNLKNTKYKLDL